MKLCGHKKPLGFCGLKLKDATLDEKMLSAMVKQAVKLNQSKGDPTKRGK